MSALIGVQELARALDRDRPPVVLDVRWSLGGPPGRAEHDRGHLPGAHFVDLETELAGPASAPDARGRRPGGRHPLPSPAVVEAALRRAGVHTDSAVVVHDQAMGYGAARAWWVLRWAGVADVRVLDGGVAAWTADGHPLTTDETPDQAGTVAVQANSMPVLDADAAARFPSEGILLDARATDRYAGDVEPMDPVAGHVPGAVSAPTTGDVGANGRMLPPEALRERFAALGVDGSTPVATYCGSGVSAAQQVLALHEAGIDAALYVGSWSDWVGTDRPVATGREPG